MPFAPSIVAASWGRHAHAQFDFLSGVAESARTENDLIRPEVFERLKNRLADLGAKADHANVHFAHAASEESQRGRTVERWGAKEAADALRIITQTSELFGRWFLYSSAGAVLPALQYDQFRHLDAPLASDAATFDVLRDRWKAFDRSLPNGVS